MSSAVGKIIRRHHSSSRPRTWHSRPPQYATRRSHRDRFCDDSSPWAIRPIFFRAKPHDEIFAWPLESQVRWHCGKAQRKYGRQSVACKQVQRSTHQGKCGAIRLEESTLPPILTAGRSLWTPIVCGNPYRAGTRPAPTWWGVRRPVPGQRKGYSSNCWNLTHGNPHFHIVRNKHNHPDINIRFLCDGRR